MPDVGTERIRRRPRRVWIAGAPRGRLPTSVGASAPVRGGDRGLSMPETTAPEMAQISLDGSVRRQCKFTAWRDGDVRGRPSSVPVSVVDAVVVEAVLEARAECSDREQARAALNEALLAARAPSHGGASRHGARPTTSSSPHWTVTMTVGSPAPSPRSVDAVIVDDAGTIVAQRTLTDRSARACLPLARAVGAWASLVLDAEMNRARDDDGCDAPPSSSAAPPSATRTDPPLVLGRDGTVSDSAPAPVVAAPRRAVELGTMVYLRNGLMRTGGVAGLSPFVTVELTPSWVLRPALFFGRSTERIASSTGDDGSVVSHVGLRTNFCRRIPGNYIERRGVEADLCAGVEGGIVTPSHGASTVGRFGLGPSVNMRGELGGGVALEIRALLGSNLVQYAAEQTPLVFASAEIGMSVRFR